MRRKVTDSYSKHRRWKRLSLVVVILLCSSLLMAILSLCVFPCGFKSPQSPCKFHRGGISKILEGSHSAASNIEDPDEAVLPLDPEDILRDNGFLFGMYVRHHEDAGVQITPIYLQTAAFLC